MYIKSVLVGLLVLVGVSASSACTPHEIAAWQALHLERESIRLNPFLTCVRHHESDRGPYPYANGYQAQNPRSSASGAYQWLDGSWVTVSRMAGHPGYARAKDAPAWVQDAVTLYVIEHPKQTGGKSHWKGTGCT